MRKRIALKLMAAALVTGYRRVDTSAAACALGRKNDAAWDALERQARKPRVKRRGR